MKISFYGTLLLIISLSFAGIFITNKVNENKENVELEETTILGDVSAAKNLSVTYLSNCTDRLHWTTDLTIGPSISLSSKFIFEEQRITSPPSSHLYIGLRSNFGSSTSGSMTLLESNEFDLPFIDVASRTSAGTTYSEIVNLNNYYRYLPLYITNYNTSLNSLDVALTEDENGSSLFNQFFRFPMSADYKVEIEITKNQEGSVNEIAMHNTANNYSSLTFSTAYTGTDKCYFAYTNTIDGIIPVDTSEIPGGYGVYTLLYLNDEPSSELSYDIPDEINVSQLQIVNFCAFDQTKTNITNISLSDDNKILFVLAKEDNAYVVYCVDTASGSILNQIDLSKDLSAESSLSQFLISNDAIMLLMSDQTVAVLSNEDRDNYALVAVANLDDLRSHLIDYLNMGENLTAFDFLNLPFNTLYTPGPVDIANNMTQNNIIYSYHDGKLALFLYAGYSNLLSHYIAVYDNNELTYLGFYDYKGDHDYNDGSVTSRTREDITPVRLSW